tara:strand:- start:635 stop:982 length:348 start_codon:yes stop_codon:yes gene_type:complete
MNFKILLLILLLFFYFKCYQNIEPIVFETKEECQEKYEESEQSNKQLYEQLSDTDPWKQKKGIGKIFDKYSEIYDDKKIFLNEIKKLKNQIIFHIKHKLNTDDLIEKLKLLEEEL